MRGLSSTESGTVVTRGLEVGSSFIFPKFSLTSPRGPPRMVGDASIGSPAVRPVCYTCALLDYPGRQDVRETRDHLYVRAWAASFSACASPL